MSFISKVDLKIALNSVKLTRWRSFLTILGVVIGISSVITVVSIGEGIKDQINNQVNQLGKDLITVRPGTYSSSGLNSLSILSTNSTGSSLSAQDDRIVSTTNGVGSSSPLSVIPGVVSAPGQSVSNPLVIGASPSIQGILNQGLQYGQFFVDNDTVDTAVVGQAIASRLFPGEVALGHSFSFLGQTFIVRGVFDSFDAPPLSLQANYNDAIFIPFSLANQLENNSAVISEILVKPTNSNDTRSVASTINSNLLKADGGVQDFTVLRQSQGLVITNNILDLLAKLIVGIATISLLVGGVGIMNVMLVSVSERTQEIGIRKAIGATNKQILAQFLTEAMILSLFGGLVGIIVSFAINGVLRVFTGLQPVIVWQIVVISTVVSLIIGIVFGIMPAFKAARKEPIDALRYQ
ncbi:MAG TPA: ABC transporter permease [Candidatus Saccharimonadales bacterium]|nr:ABC transporter permease [Candidatus Saccharimonadales bacterium]